MSLGNFLKLNRGKEQPVKAELDEYSLLQRKEKNGTITEEEFLTLTRIEIEKEQKENPPLKTPLLVRAELKDILKLKPAEKDAALEVFKDKLVRQQEILARFRVLVEKHIDTNPDITLENLQNFVEEFCKTYRLMGQHKQDAMELVYLFFSSRKAAKDLRKHFPSDFELVKELTGLNFNDKEAKKFKVGIGLMNIDIYTSRENAKRIFENSIDKRITEIDSAGFSAFASYDNNKWSTKYNVYTVNDLKGSEYIRIHEEEHQKNRILQDVFDWQTEKANTYDMYHMYEYVEDEEEKEKILKIYFTLSQKKALVRAKDEILAMAKDRVSDYFEDFFKKDSGSYDYLSHIRDFEPKKGDPPWQKLSESILVRKYEETILKALDAFDEIDKYGSYNRNDVIALFAPIPLEAWPKTARRIIEQKKMNSSEVG